MGPVGRDAVRPFNKPSARREDGERKGEVVDPAAGVDAPGPTSVLHEQISKTRLH